MGTCCEEAQAFAGLACSGQTPIPRTGGEAPREVKCKHAGCEKEVKFKDKDSHEAACDHRLVRRWGFGQCAEREALCGGWEGYEVRVEDREG